MEPNERTTRKLLIDRALQATGWSPILTYRERVPHPCGAVEEYPTANGPVDYALFDNGNPIALVEAKKLLIQRYENALQTVKSSAAVKSPRRR